MPWEEAGREGVLGCGTPGAPEATLGYTGWQGEGGWDGEAGWRDVLNRDPSLPGALEPPRGSKERPCSDSLLQGEAKQVRSGLRRGWAWGQRVGRARQWWAQAWERAVYMLPPSEAAAAQHGSRRQRASRAWASVLSRASYLVLLQLLPPGLLLRLLGLNQLLTVLHLVDAELVLHLRLRLLTGRDGGPCYRAPTSPGAPVCAGCG